VISGDSSQSLAIESFRANAQDFLTKPVTLAQLNSCFSQSTGTESANDVAYTDCDAYADFPELFDAAPSLRGNSDAIRKTRGLLDACAGTAYHVVLVGEVGLEKTTLSNAIHQLSKRHISETALSKHKVVHVHGSEFNDVRFSNESHAKSAEQHLDKLIARAAGGTLAITDIAKSPAVIQERLANYIASVKNSSHVQHDSVVLNQRPTRIIATLNSRDGNDGTANALEIQPELYYRLSEILITVPALRDRQEDILNLAQTELQKLNHRTQSTKVFTSDSKRLLSEYHWPGNILELKNVIGQAYMSSGDRICIDNDLLQPNNGLNIEVTSEPVQGTTRQTNESQDLSNFVGKTFWETEKILLFATLDSVDGDKAAAAKMLGISLKTLYNRINAYS